ncbi:glycine/D-amino acid oxidase-like deaminating enzyme [Sphingosinicella microcystinivorans]|uniref:Glycine/D-amino acid oxidase-like deaminating enzyme n=1 Tax=Sphingosinicella microcystinivorans TaxID=335406 RepID=A0ABX9SVH8_SPHMI|nr:glycine/D-amino acid oxidase-like deaminating enzyme [Sphingosinicella microcystinivorans]
MLWEQTSGEPEISAGTLEQTHTTEVAIVGGGYTGLSTGLALAEAGVPVAIIETYAPGYGASGRNAAGVVGIWPASSPTQVVAAYGSHRGARMNTMLAGAVPLLDCIILKYGICCDWTPCGIAMVAQKPAVVPMLSYLADDWARYSNPVRVLDVCGAAEVTGTNRFFGGILFEAAGRLNPLSYTRGLARAAVQRGAALFCGQQALSVERTKGRWTINTERGSVVARSLLIATDAYSNGLWPVLKKYFYRVPLSMVSTSPLSDEIANRLNPVGMPYTDANLNNLFWVMVEGGNRLVTTTVPPRLRPGDPARVAQPFERKLRRVYKNLPELHWEHAWSGYVGVTKDRLPRILRLGDDAYTIYGYSGQGIANATAIGAEAANLLQYGPDNCAMPITEPSVVTAPELTAFAMRNFAFPAIRLLDRYY